MRIQYNTQRPYTEKGQRIVMEYKPHEGVILFNDVDKWFTSHEENHADAHLLVKCVKAA